VAIQSAETTARHPLPAPSEPGLGTVGQIALLAAIVASVALAGPNAGNLVFGLPYAAIGVLLAFRRPSNAIGWILCAIALAGAAGAWDWAIASAGLAIGWTGIAQSITGGLTVGLLFLLTVVFPSGRLPGGRWGAAVRVELALLVVAEIILVLSPTLNVNGLAVANPIGIPAVDANVETLVAAVTAATLIAMFVTAMSLMLVRLNRSAGVERQQLKWVIASLVAAASGFAIGLLSVPFAEQLGNDIWIPWIGAAIAFPLPPIAVGVAVMRYRLYEIDRIVNRALVYGTLTAILAGVFAALAGLTQRLIVAVTGETSDAAVVLATLAVATLYTPLRTRVESVIDLRFKYQERRFGPYREELERALSLSEPVRAARRLAAEATRELEARGCAVISEDGSPTATAGEWPLPPVMRLAIPGGHGALEAILVGPRRDGHPHDPRPIAQLEELAQTVVAAVELHALPHSPAGDRRIPSDETSAREPRGS
jgi:hypothetical protein